MDAVDTLVFDVMGTVVDDDHERFGQATALLTDAGLAPARIPALLSAWNERIDARMDAVRAGQAPWQGHRSIRRVSLRETLEETGVVTAPGLVDELSGLIHHLRPWPDSPAALTVLRQKFRVVALSNADPAELIGLSAAGGLAWHGVLSASLAQSFKPDPKVYRMALGQLGVDAAQVMMVAAHPWDLRAAAREGLATAYINRPGAEGPRAEDHFTVVAEDLNGLARILDRIATRPAS
jgi:2-haloacid dehalogenase